MCDLDDILEFPFRIAGGGGGGGGGGGVGGNIVWLFNRFGTLKVFWCKPMIGCLNISPLFMPGFRTGTLLEIEN